MLLGELLKNDYYFMRRCDIVGGSNWEDGIVLELNKIHLGDCYELIKQLPDKSVDCVYTDVPYLYSNGYHKHENNCGVGITDSFVESLSTMINGIDYKIYDDFVRICKKVNVFIWCSKEQVLDTLNYFEQGRYLFDILFWGKSNPQPLARNSYLADTEYCLHLREKGVPLNDGYELKSKWYSGAINKRDKDLYEHPTIKPLALVKRHILHATQPNDIILDPFMGSGTTAVAAQETGRQFIGFEIESKWHKIACDRVKGITATGQFSLFNQLNNKEIKD